MEFQLLALPPLLFEVLGDDVVEHFRGADLPAYAAAAGPAPPGENKTGMALFFISGQKAQL